MNGREALKALADGKKVRLKDWPRSEFLAWSDEAGSVVNQHGNAGYLYLGNDWLVVEEPASDQELIAEMERRADSHAEPQASAYAACAKMLRQRRVQT